MDPILYLGFLVALLLPSFTAANGPCTKDNLIALTFDDGPYEYENIISSYLHNLNIKATFFVNGCNYGCIYDEANVRRLRKSKTVDHLTFQTICVSAHSSPMLAWFSL